MLPSPAEKPRRFREGLPKDAPVSRAQWAAPRLRPRAPSRSGSREMCGAGRWWPGRGEIPPSTPETRLRPGHVAAMLSLAPSPGCRGSPVSPGASTEVCARPAWLGCSPMAPGPGAAGCGTCRGWCLAAGSRSGRAGASPLHHQSLRMHLSKAVGAGCPAGVQPGTLSPLQGPTLGGEGRGSPAGPRRDAGIPPLRLPSRPAPISLTPSARVPGCGAQGSAGATARSQRLAGTSPARKFAQLPTPGASQIPLPLHPRCRSQSWGITVTVPEAPPAPRQGRTCGASGGCSAPGLFRSPGSRSPRRFPVGRVRPRACGGAGAAASPLIPTAPS